jgi:SWIM zinc finger
MATGSVHAETREERGLELYWRYGDEIEQLSADIFAVPSQDGLRTYRVDYANEFCSCPDHQYRDANCVHILACGVWHAKRFRCDLCGEWTPKAERVEVHEEQVVWGMGVREGDRLCRECARAEGVA